MITGGVLTGIARQCGHAQQLGPRIPSGHTDLSRAWVGASPTRPQLHTSCGKVRAAFWGASVLASTVLPMTACKCLLTVQHWLFIIVNILLTFIVHRYTAPYNNLLKQ